MPSIIVRKLASSVTVLSGMTRREWWCVMPHGRIASYSGCTEVLVEGASTPNLPRVPSESLMPSSLDPDVGLLHYLLPAREVGTDLLAILLGRVADRLDAQRRVAAADLGLGQHRGDLLLQALEHRARRLRRRKDADPGVDHEAVEPALDERRHLGQRPRALRRRHSHGLELAALHELLRRCDRGEHERNLAADHVAHRLPAALVGNVRERQAGALRKQLAGEMRRAASARRSIGKILF